MREELYRINQKGETKDLIHFRLCGTTFPDKGYVIYRPDSAVWCIEYVESGCGTVHLGEETFYPRAGDSYFLHARKDHHYFSDCNDPWKKHFINVSGKLIDSLIEGYGLSQAAHFKGLDLGEEIGRIIAIARTGCMDNTPELINLMNAIFLKMHAHIRTEDRHSEIGMQMKDFLNTQITSKFRLDRLCRQFSRSESQTIRIFKREFGVTPYTYVLNKKLDFAKKLFVDTNLTVKEVAQKLCFSDEYYFSELFKEKVGCSPSQYRRAHARTRTE